MSDNMEYSDHLFNQLQDANKEITRLQSELTAARDEAERLRVRVIPIDPRNGSPQITNQMKADCIGEFEFNIEQACSACYFDIPDEGCEVCQGDVECELKVSVPWDLCKKIYKAMAGTAMRQQADDLDNV